MIDHEALTNWLGDGGTPVPHELAEKRAAICVSCPLNVAPDWLEKNLKEPIAQAIIKTLEIKNAMKIETSHDDKLAICSACGCVGKLHVHSPLLHILQHTQMQTMARFEPNCWILKGDRF